MIKCRPPNAEDASAITRIDAEGLATGHASFRDTPHDWDSFKSTYQTGRALALLAVDGTNIAGWAAISPTSARDVYRGVGEASIYVAAERQGQGIGRALLSALVETAEKQGYWTLIAQIFPENEASLALHEAYGFEWLGIRKRLGKMTHGPCAGQWRDVIMLERRSTTVG